MAIITLTVPDVVLPDVIDALCDHGGYQATIENPMDGTSTPNPLTKGQFAKLVIIRYMKAKYRDYIHAQDVAAVPEPAEPDIT